MKKILYILIIIALIIAGIFVAKEMSEENGITKTSASTIKNTIKTNQIEESNKVESEENKTENNTVENGGSELSPEEQAKQIAKDNWGEDDSVYYSYDGKDEKGRYVICVREKATTKALYRYYIDLETGSFEIE